MGVVLSSELKNLNLYQMLYANAYNGLKKTKTKTNKVDLASARKCSRCQIEDGRSGCDL